MSDICPDNDHLSTESASPEALYAQAQRLLAAKQPREAAAVFQRLLAESSAPALVRRAVAGLSDCLTALKEDPAARAAVFQALFAAYRRATALDGNGLAQEIDFVMLQHAGPAERQRLADLARQALAADGDAAAAEACWQLLLDLASADRTALEEVFAECRQAGYAWLVAGKLLDLDRVSEALMAAREQLPTTEEFLRFANSAAAHAQMRAIMAQAEERLAKDFDPDLADWLALRYAERGDLPRSLAVRLRLLKQAPGRGDYEVVQALAQRLGIWGTLQPELLRLLQTSPQPEARIELAMAQGDLSGALRQVALAPERYGEALLERLAAYAAGADPDRARTLCSYLEQRALALQGRGRAREAAARLARLQEIQGRTGRVS